MPLAAFARDRAADDVDDAQHAAALALDLLHRRQGVERLARLADGDVERVHLDHGIAVAELRRGLGLAGDARQLLDQVGAHDAGNVGRAAAQDPDAAHVQQLARRERDAAEMRGLEARLEPAAERAPQRLGLVGDLLAHVVRRTRPCRRPRPSRPIVERRLDGAARRRACASRSRRRARPRSRRRRDGRRWWCAARRPTRPRRTNISLSPMPSTTGLPLRATTSDVGPLGIHDGKAIGADHQPQHRAHDGLQRRAVVHQRDQMGEHLGVGVGAEDRAARGELRAQRGGVLDDAVVHDGVAAARCRCGDGRCGRSARRWSPSAYGRCRTCP